MIIKKSYGEDDYVIIKLIDIQMLVDQPSLIGIVLDYLDADDIWKLDDKVALTIDESVEVIEV